MPRTIRDKAVDALLGRADHPKRAEIERLRQIVLAADPRMREAVKWGGPTFSFADSRFNFATIVLRSTKAVTMFFPEGADLPDPTGLLAGEAARVRTAKFESLAEIERKKATLQALVRTFCRRCQRSSAANTPSTRRKRSP